MASRARLDIARAKYWDAAYEGRGAEGVSWYQATPQRSVELIESLALDSSAAIVDVGGGTSRLIDLLFERGFTSLTVLDVSEAALMVARQRLGPSDAVTWLHEDLLTWQPLHPYDVWHDRAVFHFLVDQKEREAYVRTLRCAIRPGGWVIIATFAEDGPEQCSGLPVVRYSAPDLADAIGSNFDVLESSRDVHVTPEGVRQPFTWIVARAIGGTR